MAEIELESEVWFLAGRLGFTVVNHEFFPPKACTPDDRFEGLYSGVVQRQLPVIDSVGVHTITTWWLERHEYISKVQTC